MKKFLPELVRSNGVLDLSSLKFGIPTKYVCITGPDNCGKTNLWDGLAEYFSKNGKTVITAKASYDEQLSNYMSKLRGFCDFFICQGSTIDQYVYEAERSVKEHFQKQNNQQVKHLARFNMYIHLDCNIENAKRLQRENKILEDAYNVYFDTTKMSESDILGKAVQAIYGYIKYLD